MKRPLPNYLNRLAYNLFCGLFVCLLWGCGGARNPGKDVIASFGNQDLLREEVDFFTPDSLSLDDSTRYADQYIEQWFRLQAIREEARREVSDLDKKVQFKLKQYEYQLLAFEFANWLISEKPEMMEVSEADIENYYDRYPERFVSKANYYQFFYIKTDQPGQYKVQNWLRNPTPENLMALSDWAEENNAVAILDSLYRDDQALDHVAQGFYYGNIRKASTSTVYPYQHVEEGNTYYDFFRMLDIIEPGEAKPLSMCRQQIINTIRNQRKNTLIEQTETSLVQKARAAKKVNKF